MGWFDEQLRQRKKNDQDVFSDTFTTIAEAVVGSRRSSASGDGNQQAKNAIERILKYYHIKVGEVPDQDGDIHEQLEVLMRPHGIMRRTIDLEEGWYKDAIGVLIAKRSDTGRIVALIPAGNFGYFFLDDATGKRVKITKKTEKLIAREAICFYKPLPLRSLGLVSLMQFILHTLSLSDFVMTGLATLLVTLVGLFTPRLTKILFSDVIQSGNVQVLLAVTITLVCITISSMLIDSLKSLLMSRINTKMNIAVQAATMMRVLSLPAGFFKEYSAGELSSRAQNIGTLCNLMVSTILGTGLTSIFSLVYISQIFSYAPALVAPAFMIILITVVFSTVSAFVQMNISKKQMLLGAKESGMSYALISGIQKIRLSGAEKRAFARWGNLYAQESALNYNPPMFIKINAVISTAISMVGMLVMYYAAVKSQVTVADYYAFNTAYGMVSGAFFSLSGIALTVARFKPIMDMAKPILKAVPEVSEGKQVINRLSGTIELNNVSFRYQESMPLVVHDLSLKIRPGQYVAIVGRTGCGKSTLMRLMLGFETPQKGAIYYDGKDLSTIDLKSLRRKIGVVMQNGKLFQGDIFSNITISAPWLTLEDAWEAAELAGIAEDIRRMPMGMHTIISEGSGGVSGGQRQRLMIARAIAPKPRILMFDEATSALDNITQRIVSESLDKLKCTRIVIAHRLSTIRQCDRILVVDKGAIIEDGTYESLIAQNDYFAEFVSRQRIDGMPEATGATTA